MLREAMIDAVTFLLRQAKGASDPAVHRQASDLLERVEGAEAAAVVEQAEAVASIRNRPERKKPEGKD